MKKKETAEIDEGYDALDFNYRMKQMELNISLAIVIISIIISLIFIWTN